MAIIELKDVSVSFRDGAHAVDAVSHADLTVERGEFAGIIGSSGAGKSTLVRTIDLLQRPTSGRVLLDGRDVTDARGAALRAVRRRIGFVFQGFNLIGNATVGRNVDFALRAGRWSRRDRRRRVDELLGLVGLADRAGAYPGELSGGQRQRVSIARALANRPEILLCDEATSALDLATAEGVLALLRRVNRELGVTVVFITHQLEVARRAFDHVAVMDGGRIVERGTSFEVFGRPRHRVTRALAERYLGVDVPPKVLPALPADGQVLELRFLGEGALEPLLGAAADRHGVTVNVLHANVEYFGPRPIGTFLVQIRGNGRAVAAAGRDLAGHAERCRAIDAGIGAARPTDTTDTKDTKEVRA